MENFCLVSQGNKTYIQAYPRKLGKEVWKVDKKSPSFYQNLWVPPGKFFAHQILPPNPMEGSVSTDMEL